MNNNVFGKPNRIHSPLQTVASHNKKKATRNIFFNKVKSVQDRFRLQSLLLVLGKLLEIENAHKISDCLYILVRYYTFRVSRVGHERILSE